MPPARGGGPRGGAVAKTHHLVFMTRILPRHAEKLSVWQWVCAKLSLRPDDRSAGFPGLQDERARMRVMRVMEDVMRDIASGKNCAERAQITGRARAIRGTGLGARTPLWREISGHTSGENIFLAPNTLIA
jgi:hypothetical protein